jgi:hypothetical protein
MTGNKDIAATIEELEKERCRALTAGDYQSLGQLLSDDLVHMHATGLIDDKASYLKSIATALKFMKIERSSSKVRVYTDVAVMTGILEQTIRVLATDNVVEMRTAATQIWARLTTGWKQVSFQATVIK